MSNGSLIDCKIKMLRGLILIMGTGTMVHTRDGNVCFKMSICENYLCPKGWLRQMDLVNSIFDLFKYIWLWVRLLKAV